MKTQETLRNTSATDRPFEIVVWIIGILVFVFTLISNSATAKNPQYNKDIYINESSANIEMNVNELPKALEEW